MSAQILILRKRDFIPVLINKPEKNRSTTRYSITRTSNSGRIEITLNKKKEPAGITLLVPKFLQRIIASQH